MSTQQLTTLEQVSAFLAGTQVVVFEVATDKQARYPWIQKTLIHFRYYHCASLTKA